MQTEAPIALAVLAVTTLFAYDPNAGPSVNADGDPDQPSDAPSDGVPTDAGSSYDDETSDVEHDGELDPTDPPLDAPPVDPGHLVDDDVSVLANGGEPSGAGEESDGTDPFAEDDSRAPWL